VQKYETTLDDLESSLYALNTARKMFNDFLDILEKNKRKFSKPEFLQKQGILQGDEDEVDNFIEMEDDIFESSENRRMTSFSQVS
jgi:hypothetical protein